MTDEQKEQFAFDVFRAMLTASRNGTSMYSALQPVRAETLREVRGVVEGTMRFTVIDAWGIGAIATEDKEGELLSRPDVLRSLDALAHPEGTK